MLLGYSTLVYYTRLYYIILYHTTVSGRHRSPAAAWVVWWFVSEVLLQAEYERCPKDVGPKLLSKVATRRLKCSSFWAMTFTTQKGITEESPGRLILGAGPRCPRVGCS